MSKSFLLFTATLILCLSSLAVHAAPPVESDLSTLASTIRANRKALIKVNVQLTPEEAAAFWPLYDRYQKEISAIGDRMIAIVQDYTASFGDLSNEKALKLTEDYLAAEAERVKVRLSYLGEFAKVVPGRTVARFYQLENKLDAVIRYDLAATIPVVEGANSAPTK